NQHPEIRRTALVKLKSGDTVLPGLVIERHDGKTRLSEGFKKELHVLKETEEFTRSLEHFFLHSGFPVDVRHNIKIDRLKLAVWAQEKL
ncbi:MAG: peptide synthase, partial [Bacteriovoracia bacterium]